MANDFRALGIAPPRGSAPTRFVIIFLACVIASGVFGVAYASTTASGVETVPVSLRYKSQRIATCSEPKEKLVRRRQVCRSEKVWTKSTATLQLEPLVDPRRRIFGPDERRAFSVELRHESHPVDVNIEIAKGPWRITWKETSKSIRANFENAGDAVILQVSRGACRSGYWRCRLEPHATRTSLSFQAGVKR